MTYRYGVRNTSLKMDWEAAFRAAGEIGFEGVELVLREEERLDWLLGEAGRQELEGWVRESGAEACTISFALFRQHKAAQGDPAERRRVIDLVQRAIRACKGMGGAGILLPYFDRENIDAPRNEVDWIVDDLKVCAPLAEDLGMKVALETSFSSGLLKEICARIGSSAVGVYQDLANALSYGHDSVEMLTALAEETRLIHLKDTRRSDLGEGDVDFPACKQAILDIGYEGWLNFETPGGEDPVASGRKNLNFAREMFG